MITCREHLSFTEWTFARAWKVFWYLFFKFNRLLPFHVFSISHPLESTSIRLCRRTLSFILGMASLLLKRLTRRFPPFVALFSSDIRTSSNNSMGNLAEDGMEVRFKELHSWEFIEGLIAVEATDCLQDAPPVSSSTKSNLCFKELLSAWHGQLSNLDWCEGGNWMLVVKGCGWVTCQFQDSFKKHAKALHRCFLPYAFWFTKLQKRQHVFLKRVSLNYNLVIEVEELLGGGWNSRMEFIKRSRLIYDTSLFWNGIALDTGSLQFEKVYSKALKWNRQIIT